MSLTSWLGKILRGPNRTLVLTFVGWRNEELAARYHRSVYFYDTEIRAKRVRPFHPKGLLLVLSANELDDVGTPSGTELRVLYDMRFISPDDIVSYLTTLGLRVAPT